QQVQMGPAEEPRNMNGPIFVPLRAVLEHMGGTAKWNQESSSVTAALNGHTATIPGGSPDITVDGQPRHLSVSPFYQDNHIWVPLELFEAFGAPAIGDAATNTVTIQ